MTYDKTQSLEKSLGAMLEMLDGYTTSDEMAGVFEVFIGALKQMKEHVDCIVIKMGHDVSEECRVALEKVSNLTSELEASVANSHKMHESEIKKYLAQKIKELYDTIKNLPKVDESGLIETSVSRAESVILPILEKGHKTLKNEIIELGEDLDDLEKEVKAINKSTGGMTIFGGGKGFDLYVDGTKKAHTKYLNLIAGTGITLSFASVGERADLTISSSGVSLVPLTVSGTINDSNLDFTAASEPSLLVINGAAYQKTGGAITWTYSLGNITISQPVGTGGSIYGL